MAGLTTDGFEIKTLAEIKAEIEQLQLENVDANLNQSADSVIGQINAIFANQLREVWELVQAVYTSAYPDTASGQALSYLAAMTGTIRRSATPSTVSATINVDDGVTIPVGSAATVDGNTDYRYEFTEAFTNDTGSTDNFTVTLTASTSGSAVRANAGTLTVIATPITGWNTVTNVADSVDGLDEETDAELRTRRESELTLSGSATLNAIRSDLLTVADVTSVTVFENTTNVVDSSGLPGHSLEAVVLGGTDQAIADQLFLSKPAGIQAFGSTSSTVTDTAGNTHSVSFSRPTEITVYIEYDLVTDPDTYVGDVAVQNALETFGDTLSLGEDVILSQMNCAVMEIQGVLDITAVKVDTIPVPVATTNLTIGERQLAILDTANMTINS